MQKVAATVFLFSIISIECFSQNAFLKALGRDNSDVYTDMEETTDGGILFSGMFSNTYSFTRCNSLADTIWTKMPPALITSSLSDMTTLGNGNYAIAGTKNNSSINEAAIIILDSACNFVDAAYFPSQGWGMVGCNVYALPDSGVMLTAYDDGYTCSNTVNVYNLDRNLTQLSADINGVCDANLYYTDGFNNKTGLMHFLKIHYYEVDTAGNWHENVPHLYTKDMNNSVLLDVWKFIDKEFTGISSVSDSGMIIYGFEDVAGSKEIHLMKIDKNGNIAWTKTIGTQHDDIPVNVIETADNGFAVLASQNMNGTNTGIDMMFYKLTSTGQLEFSKEYGSSGNEEAIRMIKKKDGSLLLLGRTNGFGQQRNIIVQLNSTGEFLTPTSINPVINNSGFEVRTFPNPASEKIIFEIPSLQNKNEFSVFIYNMQGKLLIEEKFNGHFLEVKVNSLPPGIYSYYIRNEKEKSRGLIEIVR